MAVIGIDLGTTFSSIAFLKDGKPVVINDEEGRKSIPSVVFVNGEDIFVGYNALKYELKNPESIIKRVKRKIGTGKKIKVNGKNYSPEEISSFILKHLKNIAEKYLSEKVKDIVITVPAYFNDNQRQATKIAAELAGLNVLRIINEPTAAALSYGIKGEREENIVVYDIGGGTFDVSILSVADGVFEVISTVGDNKLGGEDFNQTLMNLIVENFKKDTSIDLSMDPLAITKLAEAVEKAKIELSSVEKTIIKVPFITADENGPKNLEFEITRKEFEDLIEKYVDKTIELCSQALEDSALKKEEIDRIVMVGGSSKIPLIRKKVSEFFGKNVDTSIDPEFAVAKGAALQAGIIQGEKSGLVLVDVIPLSLGIEVENGYFVPIIERNSPIPTSAKRIFTTVADFQKTVDIHILQGESMYAKNNVSLGRFSLEGIREAKKGIPRIEVLFEIDVNGILNVSAIDVDTRKFQQITIKNESLLSKEEIETLKDNLINIKETEKKKSLFEIMKLKTYAENLIERIKSSIPPAYFNSLIKDELSDIYREIEKSDESIELEDLKKQIERLEFIFSEISVERYSFEEVI
ncbi:MAG: Hsp70 family protein [Brevinematales bacterium]|nr:Hsp70 family protein [Brevinematales bacterium]